MVPTRIAALRMHYLNLIRHYKQRMLVCTIINFLIAEGILRETSPSFPTLLSFLYNEPVLHKTPFHKENVVRHDLWTILLIIAQVGMVGALKTNIFITRLYISFSSIFGIFPLIYCTLYYCSPEISSLFSGSTANDPFYCLEVNILIIFHVLGLRYANKLIENCYIFYSINLSQARSETGENDLRVLLPPS